MLGLVIYIGGGSLLFIILEHVLIVPGINDQRKRLSGNAELREPATSVYTNLCLIRDRLVINNLLRSMNSGSMSTFL